MITDWTTYHRNYYKKRRQRIIEYLGGKCVICGSKDNLEIDHIDPQEKSFSVSYRLSLNQIKEELSKCQLLCKKHHLEKTSRENSGFTHGTMYGWMKIKCDCTVCHTAKMKQYLIKNAKRRKGEGYKITTARVRNLV